MSPEPASYQLHHDEESIAAISSGSAPSAIAILRLTGSDCHQRILPCLKAKKQGHKAGTNKLKLFALIDPETSKTLDEPMVVFFKGPYSYTGQDSVEIYLHGGPYIIQKALELVYRLGFRAAEPGEFTRRAYLAGKLDLTEAEGIQELISAQSEQQWLAARNLTQGKLKRKIETVRATLLEAMAWLEARIDFPDEKETSEVEWQQVDKKISLVKDSLETLRTSFSSGQVARHGLKVAIFGKPNAGKSTLMNELLDKQRAIVTATAGTTRDYLEESCLINSRLFRFIDTAGIRESSCEIEKLGVQRSFDIAKKADMVLFLLPCDANAQDILDMEEWTQSLKPKNYLKVLTKSDLPEGQTETAAQDWIKISSHTGAGLASLKDQLTKQIDSHIGMVERDVTISSPRHKAAIEEALEGLLRYTTGRQAEAYEEMLAFELLQVAKALSSIIGAVDSDEVLGVIFSSFCVGK